MGVVLPGKLDPCAETEAAALAAQAPQHPTGAQTHLEHTPEVARGEEKPVSQDLNRVDMGVVVVVMAYRRVGVAHAQMAQAVPLEHDQPRPQVYLLNDRVHDRRMGVRRPLQVAQVGPYRLIDREPRGLALAQHELVQVGRVAIAAVHLGNHAVGIVCDDVRALPIAERIDVALPPRQRGRPPVPLDGEVLRRDPSHRMPPQQPSTGIEDHRAALRQVGDPAQRGQRGEEDVSARTRARARVTVDADSRRMQRGAREEALSHRGRRRAATAPRGDVGWRGRPTRTGHGEAEAKRTFEAARPCVDPDLDLLPGGE